MRLFTCVDHDGLWSVPVASVVLAEDEASARALLDVELRLNSVKDSVEAPYTLREVPIDRPVAVVLSNGNY